VISTFLYTSAMHLNSYPTTRIALLLSLQPSGIFEGGGCAIFAKRELYVA
jgi:hypothetical protein